MSGELIDVAIKSDEYCFLWIDWWVTCLTKSEWASWLQAIFSVIAIFASAFIAKRQFINTEIVKEESAARVLLQFFGQINIFYEQWSEIENHKNKKSLEFFDSLNNFENVLNENFQIIKGIPLEHLSAEWATCCIFARSICVQLVLSISNYKREIQIYNELIDQGKHDAEELNEKFQSRVNKIEPEIINFKKSFDEYFNIMKKTMDRRSRFSSPLSLKKYFNMRKV